MVMSFVLISSIMPSYSFADTIKQGINSEEDYTINSVKELKQEINDLEVDYNQELNQKEVQKIEEDTKPETIELFINDKQEKIDEILSDIGEVNINNELDDGTYVEKYDLGDNCWLELKLEEEEVPSLLEEFKQACIPSVYAFSQSGYTTAWKKYGKWTYTASATANYVVAMGGYNLKVYYILSSGGIKVTDQVAYNVDVTLLNVSNVKEKITDNIATKPGASDCDSYAVFKTTYGYNPVVWSRNHIMRVKIKYLGIDRKNKEIHRTCEWSFKPY